MASAIEGYVFLPEDTPHLDLTDADLETKEWSELATYEKVSALTVPTRLLPQIHHIQPLFPRLLTLTVQGDDNPDVVIAVVNRVLLQMTQLRTLSLEECGLEKIPLAALLKSKTLKEIHLENNLFTEKEFQALLQETALQKRNPPLSLTLFPQKTEIPQEIKSSVRPIFEPLGIRINPIEPIIAEIRQRDHFDDAYLKRLCTQIADEPDPTQRERLLLILLERFFHTIAVPEDGNCLFHAISLQVTDKTAADLREETVSYIRKNRDVFSHYTLELMESYCERMARPKTWAGEIEMAALSEMHGRPICLFHIDHPLKIVGDTLSTVRQEDPTDPLFLFHRRGNHYDALLRKEDKDLPFVNWVTVDRE